MGWLLATQESAVLAERLLADTIRLGAPVPDPLVRELQRSIIKHRTAILAAIEHGLSNGRIESMNTKIRLIARVAFGFKSPGALIAIAMLSFGGHKPVLPGRI